VTNIDTVREALENAKEILRQVSSWQVQPYAGARYECLFCGSLNNTHAESCISVDAQEALATLSTIDPDAIRRDCEKRTAVIATERNLLWMLAYDLRYKKPDNDREFSDYEADVLLEKICPAGFDNEYEQLRAAILGTEPAREES